MAGRSAAYGQSAAPGARGPGGPAGREGSCDADVRRNPPQCDRCC